MKVHQGLDHLPLFQNAVITMGTFDGVHSGHQEIINKILAEAIRVKGESVLITYEPHPRKIIVPQQEVKLLTCLDEKIEVLQSFGLDHLVLISFTKSFAEQTASEYVEDFLIKKFQPHTLVIGHDHHFGKNRSGNLNLLKQYEAQHAFEILEIEAQTIHDIEISSTKIRNAITEGDVATANTYLNRPYAIKAKVVHGKKRGRSIGFPTANLELLCQEKIAPKFGVYAVYVQVGKKQYSGMLNIGYNPTFENNNSCTIEVHIIDFDQDIYDEIIQVRFVHRIRDEQKFLSIEDLIAQLHDDKLSTLRLLP
ncbi:MAG: bifunctional riboflavin kinase/FAD synthetase [Chitinophagaceae bacterium]